MNKSLSCWSDIYSMRVPILTFRAKLAWMWTQLTKPKSPKVLTKMLKLKVVIWSVRKLVCVEEWDVSKHMHGSTSFDFETWLTHVVCMLDQRQGWVESMHVTVMRTKKMKMSRVKRKLACFKQTCLAQTASDPCMFEKKTSQTNFRTDQIKSVFWSFLCCF